MSEAKTIARPYATAVWRHAVAHEEQSRWAEMLAFMAAVIKDKTMAAIVADPRVAGNTLADLMLAICGKQLNSTAEALVRLLVENGKLGLVPAIAEVYNELATEAGGALQATLTTAYPIEQAFEKSIAAAMKKRLRRAVRFTTKIDKDLLGGVVIRAGDLVIDASLRGQLQALATQLRV